MRLLNSVFISGLAALAASGLGASEPVPPALFTCSDPDLEVTVWAHSPLLFNPTNIDIDQHGRIWVAEGVNYRQHFNRRPEGDRIMVVQDTDGDGKADKSWPFVQEKFLRAPLGVAVIGDKVVVSMAPDLIVYTDKDGDAVFDAAKGDTREVLLTGFNGRNHDHSLHSVTVGPDGKWYFSAGNCGAKFTDKSGKTFRIGSRQNVSWWPKDPDVPDMDPNEFAGQKSDDGRVYVGGFIARMNPDGTNVEILAHNLRNSYENCVTSFGDIFASDNDDSPACRVFHVLEGGNYGFASADGQRTWQADRRPGQSIQTATWRQEDPGVAPAGDIYGGGAPTGCVFYENGALGTKHEGTLLVCESARNTIFGYKLKLNKKSTGYGAEAYESSPLQDRFNFLTTNTEEKVVGTDYTGGDSTAKRDDTKTLFRPSDIAVGPDGAVYISDWHDARVGGHNDLDESLAGTIYRVAPKGLKNAIPKVDTSTLEGALEAMKSPALHVRAIGTKQILRPAEGKVSDPEGNRARIDSCQQAMRSVEGTWLVSRFLYHVMLHGEARIWRTWDTSQIGFLERLAKNRGFAAMALNFGLGAWVTPEMYALAASGVEARSYKILYSRLISKPDLSEDYLNRFYSVAFQLHPPQSVPLFKTRALAATLPERARKDAVTAIGFNDTKEAAEAMLEIAEKTDGPVKAAATWWLLNRKDSSWKDHNLGPALKEKGIYDPDKVQPVAISLPEPPPPAFSVADAAKLTGDVARGKAAVAKCAMCHRVGADGVDFGPELTTWGRTQTTEVILRSIIEPSADIAHGFSGTEVECHDGTVIQGLLISDGEPLIITSQGGMTQMIPRAKVKAKRGMSRSLMMSATQLGLTAQETADIAFFLRQGAP